MDERRRISATRVVTLAFFSLAATAVLFGALAGPAAAAHDSPGNYSVVLPEESDHLPGDQNPANASIQHFAETGSSFDGKPADRLEVMKWLVISSDEVDFSGCTSSDTNALGIDRGSNNSGTQNDDSILQNMLDSGFQEDKIWVEFNGEDDFGETVSISREDSIIAVQSDCYTMPSDPGWYQISGKINGTGPDGNFFEVTLDSHYFAVCEGCHDEATAQEKLGPRPGEGSTNDETPTATATATATPTPTATATEAVATETPSSTEAATETATAAPEATETPTRTATATEAADGNGDDGLAATPTPGEGPGFGAVAALVALLSGAALVRRRR
ncbi:PGF-CTERM sorting domain-containing protein [Natronomonas halophila]|uniref:PGF-CTERM sorting domain-containing protein n=1 Tax=Natronomonas halophila TaxID=2747817 RepID=UPI0015B5A02F|nr:PGF-CTERM sorting domain-containing protein [Natronomonas halophila]QLD85733.1 PGF-CTERM sorting domain-containing protein [Natronomonas halophila]